MKDVLTKLKMRLPAIVLLAATVLFWGVYDRYESAGPVLLKNPLLSDAFKVRGDATQTNDVFRLHVPDLGKRAEVRFRLSDASDYPMLRARARIRTEEVVIGKYAWNSARLILIQRDAAGKWIPGHPHQLHAEHGSVDWGDQHDEFEIEPHAKSAELVLQQSGSSGTAWFDSIDVFPVQVKASYPWFRVGFTALWLWMGFLYFRRCRLDHRKLRILILLNVLVILYGTLMPGNWIAVASERVKERVVQRLENPPKQEVPVGNVLPKSDVKKSQSIDAEQKKMGPLDELIGSAHKVGHFVLFASLCFLVYWSTTLEGQKPAYYLKVAFDLLLFAGISESLQFLTGDRTPDVSDWMMDVYGMFAAFVLFLIMRILRPVFIRFGTA